MTLTKVLYVDVSTSLQILHNNPNLIELRLLLEDRSPFTQRPSGTVRYRIQYRTVSTLVNGQFSVVRGKTIL